MAKNRKFKGKQQRGVPTPRAIRKRNERYLQTDEQDLFKRVLSDTEPPAVPEGAAAARLLHGGEQVILSLPAPALVKVLEIAANEGAELTLPFTYDAVDPNGNHRLGKLMRVQGEGIDFVRAFAWVFQQTLGPAGEPALWQGWLDLPTRYVGMMLEAAEPRDLAQETTQPEARRANPGIAPRWAGSWTFDRAWETSMKHSTTSEEGRRGADGTVTTSPSKVVSVEMLHLLRECHLIRVEAAQVDVLPEWEELSQAFDYAQDVHLPFDPLYLEFEGVGGIAPVFKTRDASVTLRGATVMRDLATGNLTVSPFGDVTVTEDDQTVFLADPYFPAGRVVFGAVVDEEMSVGPQELIVPGRENLRAVATGVNTMAFDAECKGVVICPFAYDYDVTLSDDSPPGRVFDASKRTRQGEEKVTLYGCTVYASAVLAMALRALAALSIMESDVVVVEDAPMEKRDAKRAEKRGWDIAQQVFIRPVRKGARRSEPTGNERDYTHRFWVRGHMKHFGLDTRMAQNRPDLVKPCTRAGEAMCDGGVCRRIWTPPFIKGPDDKPLVLKSLVKREPREEKVPA